MTAVTRFTEDDAVELRGVVMGLYTPAGEREAKPFMVSAIADFLTSEGVDETTATDVAPAVLKLLKLLKRLR